MIWIKLLTSTLAILLLMIFLTSLPIKCHWNSRWNGRSYRQRYGQSYGQWNSQSIRQFSGPWMDVWNDNQVYGTQVYDNRIGKYRHV